MKLLNETNLLKSKTNTAKHPCENSKCWVAMYLNKNSRANTFSSLTKTWNSPFECLSIKVCCNQNLFPLILLFLHLKRKLSNLQNINFLAEIFAIAFEFTRSFLKKFNFSRSLKIFFEPRKIFLWLRKIIFSARGKISEADSPAVTTFTFCSHVRLYSTL